MNHDYPTATVVCETCCQALHTEDCPVGARELARFITERDRLLERLLGPDCENCAERGTDSCSQCG